MKRFAALVARRPWLVLGAVVLATGLAAAGLVDPRTGEPRLRIDASVDRLLARNGESARLDERNRRLFGSPRIVFVVVAGGDVFTPENLERVSRLSARLEAVEGVASVLSLSTAVNVRGVDGDVLIGPFFESVPREVEALEQLRQAVLDNPMVRDTLVAPDQRATALVATLAGVSHEQYVARVDPEIRRVAQEEARGAEVWVTGDPHVRAVIDRTLRDELAVTMPGVLAVAAVVLLLAFRNVSGVVIPLATMAIALVWALGILGWLGRSLNVVTVVVPPLIGAIGFTYAIHVVSEFQAVLGHGAGRGAAQRAEATRRTLADVSLPVAVTGLTTAIGFLSLTVTPIRAVQEFGLYAVLGVVCTAAAALVFAPAALRVFSRAGPRRAEGAFDRAAEGLAAFALRRRRAILFACAVLLLVAAGGMTRIRIGADRITNFSAESPVRLAYEAIQERFGGTDAFSVILESDARDAFAEPVNLRAVEELQAWLVSQPEITSALSVVDFLKLLNRELNDHDPAAFRVPETRRLAKQLYFFGASDETDRFVDSRYQVANVLVRASVEDTVALSRLLSRVEARLGALPPQLRGNVSGELVQLGRTIEEIGRGQVQGIALAILSIYLVLAVMFTSLRVGAVALIPNLVPILCYFGALGWSGATLNPTTSLIACIAIGIAVDDTIHYFARFNAEARALGDERQATLQALRGLIRPVTFTTLGLCLAFLVFTASELRNQVQFGLLASFTLAVAWAVDMTVTPALCAGVRVVSLWDVLTLDLGEAPHRSIPLFSGLSLRQARVFALMSQLVEVEAGQRLIREGETGSDMYVVISGRLHASVQRGDERVDLSEMGRGEVIGEIALFSTRRSADVDALVDARLLRFSERDLERLQRRYPRIAAQVYRNLNRVQAERLVRTTARLG